MKLTINSLEPEDCYLLDEIATLINSRDVIFESLKIKSAHFDYLPHSYDTMKFKGTLTLTEE